VCAGCVSRKGGTSKRARWVNIQSFLQTIYCEGRTSIWSSSSPSALKCLLTKFPALPTFCLFASVLEEVPDRDCGIGAAEGIVAGSLVCGVITNEVRSPSLGSAAEEEESAPRTFLQMERIMGRTRVKKKSLQASPLCL
jgi:hypothetical protein